jgi:hypothetical protein
MLNLQPLFNHHLGCFSPVGGPSGPKNQPPMTTLQPLFNHHLGCFFAAEAAPTKRKNQPPMSPLKPMFIHHLGCLSPVGGPSGPKKSTADVDFTTNAKSSSRMSLRG